MDGKEIVTVENLPDRSSISRMD